MKRVHVIVEGQTEEGFVTGVLQPYLSSEGIAPNPILVSQKQRLTSRGKRGGITSFSPVEWILRKKLAEDPSAFCTTMFDYYGLPTDFPGHSDNSAPPTTQPGERAEFLENQLHEHFSESPRLIPYLQVHEFEALLFTDVKEIDRILRTLGGTGTSILERLEEIVRNFDNPEEINDGVDTSPSHRLTNLYPTYDKAAFGELIAEEIGIERMRSACPHFDAWINRLENIPELP